ncbi:GTP cyclohydrolase I FolE [Sphaerobacter sp.]|uniref:GTP cyclohydrolase I FolE n=1 Tax=Sphaerobacter sp. TaxID=2099654 RepID=UPI001E0AD9A1|nr:GTP cyclohydrolase I FolE [Sphaerobacter sp.]MBX5446203.1 GTP cyclohydrolase I FolE [Sphaerobacter sp.]
MDRERIAAAVTEILRAIGEDPDRPDLRRTPQRVADLFAEMFGGLAIDPRIYLADALPEEHGELVVIRDVTVRSMCEHHLVPMVGLAHVAYLPAGRIVGFDRIVKVVDAYARRPQIQERLTRQVADTIDEMLSPAGVAVRFELEHMCMTIRGSRRPGSRVVTTAYRGVFHDDPAWRAEFHAALE